MNKLYISSKVLKVKSPNIILNSIKGLIEIQNLFFRKKVFY